MIRRYVLNMQEVLKKLEEYERKISYATAVMSFCLDYRTIFKAAVIRFRLDYRSIFLGKSQNCR